MGRSGVLLVLLIFSVNNVFCIHGGFFSFFEALGSFVPPLNNVKLDNSILIQTTDKRVDLLAGDDIEIMAKVQAGQTFSTAYEIFGPPQHKIQASCQINTPYSNDTEHVFYIEKERTSDHSNGISYNVPNAEETSLFNYMRVQLKSDKGEFKCHVKAIEADCECGWMRQAKIVNGAEADSNEFPSITSFFHRPTRFNFCGGTIIHYRHILTAAHCWVFDMYRNIQNVDVVMGVHNIKEMSTSRYFQQHRMERIIQHENYQSEDQDNDIALVQLASDIIYTTGVGPACLPTITLKSESFYGKNVQMVGWGAMSYGGAFSDVLRKVTLSVISNEECDKKIIWVNSKKICTYQESKDACQSDSGGPVYYTSKRQYVVGIISFGIRCATQAPGVNTRVSSYMDWIALNMQGNICEM